MKSIIDVHHHIIPHEYVQMLAGRGIFRSLGYPFPKWDADASLGVMDKNNIQTAIVSISAPGAYFPNVKEPGKFANELSRQMNEYCAKLIAMHPGRFGAFATLPLPYVDDAIKELEYSLDELKLNGVVLLTNYNGHYLGDPKFDKLLKELNKRKAVVFVHPMSAPGYEKLHLGFPDAALDVCFDTTRTVFSLVINGAIKKYPDIRFILAHAGGAVPYMAGRFNVTSQLIEKKFGGHTCLAKGVAATVNAVPVIGKKAPVHIRHALNVAQNVLPEGPDFYLKKFYFDTALSASPHVFASLRTLVDCSHIAYGSDYPFATTNAVPLTIKGIERYSAFTKKDIASIGNLTAKALFPQL